MKRVSLTGGVSGLKSCTWYQVLCPARAKQIRWRGGTPCARGAELLVERDYARTMEREARLELAKPRQEVVPQECACQVEAKHFFVRKKQRGLDYAVQKFASMT